MTDEGPQEPPRGRRARGSVDPGPGYPGDLPRRAYPPPQYPGEMPGQRGRAVPGDSQAAPGYPAPPGGRGRLADAAPGLGRAAAPGESAVGYGPRTPAASYGRAGAPGQGARGYTRPAAPGDVSGYPRRPGPGETVPGQGRGTDRGEGRRSYPAAPPRGPYGPGRDAGGREPGRGREPGPQRGRRAAAPHEEAGGPGVDGYLSAPPQQSRLDEGRASRAGQAIGEPPAADWSSAPRRGRRHRPEPDPEAGLTPAVRDRPAERTGPSRHGRVPGGSGVGWDGPRAAGPGQAPATGPAGGTRAAPGRTASGWAGSGPIPPGRRSPGPAGRGRGGPAGFVADPDFDLDDRRAPERAAARGRASGPSAIQPPADPRAAGEVGRDRQPRRAAVREAPAERAVEHDEVAPGGRGRSPRAARSSPRSGRRRSRLLIIGAGLAVVLGGAAVAVESGLFGGGPKHVLVTPDKMGSYVRRPQLEKQMNASQLQREVIAKSAGQASHVVSAVYEDGTSASSTKTPQMILFIGGNLSGVSPGGFIASFTQQSKGAFGTSAGSLGGSAACVNAQASVPGSVALCTWADNDTFGVVASPTMNATRLAAQLRTIRPMVEHVAR